VIKVGEEWPDQISLGFSSLGTSIDHVGNNNNNFSQKNTFETPTFNIMHLTFLEWFYSFPQLGHFIENFLVLSNALPCHIVLKNLKI